MGLFAQFGDPDKDKDYIEGPYQTTPYVKWFQPLAFGVEPPSPRPMYTGGASQSNKQIHAIWLTLPVDAKTPLFFQASANGIIYKTVTIQLVRDQNSKIGLNLSDVAITSVQALPNHDPGMPNSIVVRLDFTKFEFDYKFALDDSNYTGKPETIGWDLMSGPKP